MSVKGIVEEQYPSWDTAGRPNTPVMGQSGWNYELQQFEVWDDNDNDWIAESNSQTASHSFLEFTYGRITAPEIVLAVNASTGNDALAFNAYPSAKFATLSKALEYVAYSTSTKFLISIETDCAISSTTIVNNKTVRIVGSFNVTASSNVTFYNCHVTLEGITQLTINNARSFSFHNSVLNLQNIVIQHIASTSRLNFTGVNSVFFYGSVTTINPTSSSIFNDGTGDNLLNVFFTNPSTVDLNSTGNANVRLFSSDTNNAIIYNTSTGIIFDNLSTLAPAIIFDSNKTIYETNALALADDAQLGTIYRTSRGVRKIVIGGTANDETSWTTGTRPVSPYDGMDGFNTTDSVREYWNGTNWIQY